jgi:hypothetical protein
MTPRLAHGATGYADPDTFDTAGLSRTPAGLLL